MTRPLIFLLHIILLQSSVHTTVNKPSDITMQHRIEPEVEHQNQRDEIGTSEETPSRSANTELQINSIRDLHTYSETFTTTEDGKSQLKYTFLCLIGDEDVAYFGQTQVSKFSLTPQVMRECLKTIPDEDIYPVKPTDVTIFSPPLAASLYVKCPDLKSWDDFGGTEFLSRLMLGEVEALELIHHNPHPNIVLYHGCLVNRGRITGIVLDRYTMTLEKRLENKPNGANNISVFEEIESAIKHLHSLRLAHNNLNPANIILDKHNRPILIDFGSFKPFGRHLMESGTKGWIDEVYHTSELKHDEIALQKIRSWMEEKVAL